MVVDRTRPQFLVVNDEWDRADEDESEGIAELLHGNVGMGVCK